MPTESWSGKACLKRDSAAASQESGTGFRHLPRIASICVTESAFHRPRGSKSTECARSFPTRQTSLGMPDPGHRMGDTSATTTPSDRAGAISIPGISSMAPEREKPSRSSSMAAKPWDVSPRHITPPSMPIRFRSISAPMVRKCCSPATGDRQAPCSIAITLSCA